MMQSFLVTRICVLISKNDVTKINNKIVCSLVVAQYWLLLSSVQTWHVVYVSVGVACSSMNFFLSWFCCF